MSEAKDGGPADRRGFLKTGLRVALACALGGGAAELVAGRGRRCSTPSLCARCAAVRDCALPAALEFRGEAGSRRSG